jgi:hypothetical protein
MLCRSFPSAQSPSQPLIFGLPPVLPPSKLATGLATPDISTTPKIALTAAGIGAAGERKDSLARSDALKVRTRFGHEVRIVRRLNTRLVAAVALNP